MSDNELNLDNLLKEFDLPPAEVKHVPLPVSVTSEEDERKEIENQGNVEDITRKNIARLTRAGVLLERELLNGNCSPKMFEALAKLADSMTSAAQVLAGQELTNLTFETRNRTIDLKEWELKERFRLKEEGKDNNGPVTNVNAVFTDRESLLDAILRGVNGKAAKLSRNTIELETSPDE